MSSRGFYINNEVYIDGPVYGTGFEQFLFRLWFPIQGTHTHLPITLLVPMGSNALSSHMALCYCSGGGGHTVEGLTASSLVSRSKNPCYPATMIPGRQSGATKAFLGLEAWSFQKWFTSWVMKLQPSPSTCFCGSFPSSAPSTQEKGNY